MFFFFFYWHLLICENILIQVVKLKKKKKEKKKRKEKKKEKFVASQRRKPAIRPLGHERLLLSSGVNFTTYFFLCDKLPLNMKMLVFFLAKCVRTAAKTMVVHRKKKKH